MDKEKNRLVAVAVVIVVIIAIVAAALVLSGGNDNGGDDQQDVHFDLTVSSNEGGTVTPSGTTELAEGTTQTITITPNSGFIVSDVLLDGESVGALTSLEVEMDGDHTVEVVFAEETGPVPIEHTITASAGAGGRISPSGDVKVADGADQTFTFTANGSYRVSQVTVDGQTVTVTGNSYTFENVTGDHTISVTFRYVGGGGGGTTPSVTLTGIEVTERPDRTSYLAGEIFDKTGMVITASYSNGTTKTVEDYSCSPDGELTVDIKQITVTYQGKTATVDITVIAEDSEIQSIEVTTPPDKTHYFDDQAFVAAGMEVSAVYDGNVKIPLDPNEYNTDESNKTVTVTYNDKKTTFTITRDYTITDVDELKHFRDNVNKGTTYSGCVVSLGANIDLDNEKWIPIGYSETEVETLADTNAIDPSFGGTFDGNNHSISNLTINLPDGTSVGLFGRIVNGVVKNLTIENADVLGKSEVGVITGSFTVDITGCNITGLIQVEGNYKVGGIAGSIYGDVTDCTITASEGSYVRGIYEVKDFEGDNVGGAVGFTGEGNSTYSDINVSGLDVEGTRKVGGVIGYLHYGVTVTNSTFTNGTVTSNADEVYANSNKTFVGGIVGEFNGTTENSSIIDCTVTDTEISGPNRECLGEIYGGTRGSNEKLTATGNEYNSVTLIDPDTVTIYNVDDLLEFADMVNSGQSLDARVILMGDIDLTGHEWIPIGNVDNPFKGTFDGQNHKISNLIIDKPQTSSVGLFGYTTGGEIKKLVVENAVVTGYLEVGVVAGTPYTSKYSDITVTGHVEVNGFSYVGGVGGKNVYADWNNVKVEVDESSYVKADSENYRTYVGGIIGFMGEGSHEMNSLISNIDVIGSTCDVGGIVGIAHYGNRFVNCSSSGNVTLVNAADEGDQLEIGGIAGVWMNHNSGSVSFINCSYTGELSSSLKGVPVNDGSYPYGGLIGYKYYRDSNAGELIIEMEGVSNAIYVGIADELLEIGNRLSTNQSDYKDKTIILMNDLDMIGKEWPVINLNSAVGSLAFKGLGDGITISNLNLGNGNNETTGNIGFIAFTGSMKSLIIENISFDNLDTGTIADSGTNAVGALVGYAGTSDSITISSCNVLNSNISGGHWAGGFVGYAAGYSTQSDGPVFEVLTIENCMIENSTVSSPGSAGGLIGHATGDAWTRDEFKNCTVKGCTITSTGESTDKAGSLMGTVGAGKSIFDRDGGVFVTSCTVEGCTVKSNNTEIDRIYGRQGTPGGVLCVDGSYVAFGSTDLEDLIASGNDIYLPSGTYDIPTSLGDEFSIRGQSADTTILNIPQKLLATGSATFENVTLIINNGNYQGFNSSDSVIFRNCVLEGQFFLYGPKVEFHNCTFEQTDPDSYNIWTYAATNVLFSECMFNCAGKAVLVYNEGGESGVMKIEFIKCTMKASSPASGKAAIEVDASLFKHSCTVVIDDYTAESVTGFGTGSNSKNSVWNNKKDPTVDGVTLTITVGGEVILTKTKAA